MSVFIENFNNIYYNKHLSAPSIVYCMSFALKFSLLLYRLMHEIFFQVFKPVQVSYRTGPDNNFTLEICYGLIKKIISSINNRCSVYFQNTRYIKNLRIISSSFFINEYQIRLIHVGHPTVHNITKLNNKAVTLIS